jgi:hypothetical protein
MKRLAGEYGNPKPKRSVDMCGVLGDERAKRIGGFGVLVALTWIQEVMDVKKPRKGA